MEHQAANSGSMFQGASPKMTFVFGIVTGFALALVLGLAIFVPAFYSKGKTASTGTPTADAANTNTAAPQTFGNVKAVGSDDYIRGNKDAKITLIEYSDYECPFCQKFHPTMKKVMDEYKDKVRWVYRHFPLSFHQNAPKEAEAALCVGSLGGADKYWDFSDKIFERTTANGTGFALANLPALAKEVGVDETKFKDCLDSGKMAARVAAETADGTQGGATGTPMTFIVGPDGKTISGISGAYPYEQVKAQIDAALASI